MGSRVLALDGIRGLAILMVVAAHVSDSRAVLAGPAGVTLFFTLSGYLITSLLYREHQKNARIDLLAFYARRALRLYPAFVLAVAGTGLLYWAVGDDRFNGYWGEAGISLLYLRDFFMAADMPSGVFDHSWSLAVEEQFYLVWPLILMAVLKFARHRLQLAVNVLAGVAVLWHLAGMVLFSQERVYFAPDTNAYALLLGCALAINMAHRQPRRRKRKALAITSAALVAGLPIAATAVWGDDWVVRNSLTVLIAGLSLVLIWSARGVSLLEIPALRFFGTISYGLYLWHEVLLAVQIEGFPIDGVWRVVAAGLSVMVAWLSYRYFESPVLKLKKRFERASIDPARGTTATPEYARR